jgi:hypothetical protein
MGSSRSRMLLPSTISELNGLQREIGKDRSLLDQSLNPTEYPESQKDIWTRICRYISDSDLRTMRCVSHRFKTFVHQLPLIILSTEVPKEEIDFTIVFDCNKNIFPWLSDLNISICSPMKYYKDSILLKKIYRHMRFYIDCPRDGKRGMCL